MSFESARAFLTDRGMGDRILTFGVSSATVALAAAAIGCEPARIAKSLTFMALDGPVMIVTAGDARIDNSRYKAQFHTKARMLMAEEAEALVGHPVGGVCPFGVRDGVRIYLDASLRRFDTVYPACGNASSAVRLTPEELKTLSGGAWIDICKDWNRLEAAE